MSKTKNISKQDIRQSIAPALLKHSPNIIALLDQDAQICEFNKYAEDITGYEKNEIIGKNWIELFIPQKLQKNVLAVWKSVIGRKKIFQNYQNEIQTKKKTLRKIAWANYLLTIKKEKFVLVIGHDITDEKKEFCANSNFLIDKIFEGIIIIDFSYKIVFVNKGFLTAFAATRTELLNTNIFDYIDPDFHEQTIRDLKKAKRGKRVDRSETKIIYDDKEVWVESSIDLSDFNQTKVFLITVHDIAKRKIIEKEKNEKRAQLQEKIRELEIFQKVAVKRELKMIKLKEEIKKLKTKKNEN